MIGQKVVKRWKGKYNSRNEELLKGVVPYVPNENTQNKIK